MTAKEGFDLERSRPVYPVFALRVTEAFVEALQDGSGAFTLAFAASANNKQDKGRIVMRNSAGEEHEFVFSETKPGRESATDVIRVDAREAEMRQIGQVRGKLVLQQEAEAVAEKIGERTQAMERSKKEVHAQVITNAPSPAARAVVKKTSKRPGSTGPGPGPGRVSPLPRAADAVNLRSRLVHLLARQPQTRTDLELRLKIPQRDAQLTALLDEVAVRMADGYDLQPEGFKEVQIFTWPAYAAADRSEVLRRAHAAFDKIGLSSKDRKPYVEQPVPTSPVAPKRGDPAPPTIVTGPAPKRVRTVSKPGAGAGTGASRKAAGKKQGKGPLDISSDAQYERRRREFDNKYAVYTELYAKLQANQTAFNEKKRALDNARNMHGAASREAREIEDAIRDMHASVKEDVAKWEHEYRALHSELGRLKTAIRQYEAGHQGAA